MFFPTHQASLSFPSSGNFTIPFDIATEEFSSAFPIVLANRVYPEQYASTLHKCTMIMKEHMAKITKRDRNYLWFLLGFVVVILFAGIFPIVMVTTVIPIHSSDSWIPAVFIPLSILLLVIGFIAYTVYNVRVIKEIHVQCKKELDDLLSQENQLYYQVGIQWILRYDTDSIGKTRVTLYKHLMTLPTLEILINQSMTVVIPQEQPQYYTSNNQTFASMPTTLYSEQVNEQQPIYSSVAYQPVNLYQKQNDQQPLLDHRV